jgi:hypothetical protein
MDLKQDLGRRGGEGMPEGMSPDAARQKLRGLEEELARAHEKLTILKKEGREEAARDVKEHIAKLTMLIEDFRRGLRGPEGPGREGPRPEAVRPPVGEDIEALRREIKGLRGQLERVERLLKDLEKARGRQVMPMPPVPPQPPRDPAPPIAPRRDKGDRPAPRQDVKRDRDRDDDEEEEDDDEDEGEEEHGDDEDEN